MTRGNDRTVGERVNEFLIRRIANTKAHINSVMQPGSMVVLILVTVTGVCAVLKELEIPRKSFWGSRQPATIALGVIAALSYLGYCGVVIGF